MCSAPCDPASVIGGIELICGNGYCKEKVSQTHQLRHKTQYQAHPNKHVYCTAKTQYRKFECGTRPTGRSQLFFQLCEHLFEYISTQFPPPSTSFYTEGVNSRRTCAAWTGDGCGCQPDLYSMTATAAETEQRPLRRPPASLLSRWRRRSAL